VRVEIEDIQIRGAEGSDVKAQVRLSLWPDHLGEEHSSAMTFEMELPSALALQPLGTVLEHARGALSGHLRLVAAALEHEALPLAEWVRPPDEPLVRRRGGEGRGQSSGPA
jgi:hypothetical protein